MPYFALESRINWIKPAAISLSVGIIDSEIKSPVAAKSTFSQCNCALLCVSHCARRVLTGCIASFFFCMRVTPGGVSDPRGSLDPRAHMRIRLLLSHRFAASAFRQFRGMQQQHPLTYNTLSVSCLFCTGRSTRSFYLLSTPQVGVIPLYGVSAQVRASLLALSLLTKAAQRLRKRSSRRWRARILLVNALAAKWATSQARKCA